MRRKSLPLSIQNLAKDIKSLPSPIDRLKIFKERMQFRYYQVRDRMIETQKLRREKVYRLKPVGYKASSAP